MHNSFNLHQKVPSFALTLCRNRDHDSFRPCVDGHPPLLKPFRNASRSKVYIFTTLFSLLFLSHWGKEAILTYFQAFHVISLFPPYLTIIPPLKPRTQTTQISPNAMQSYNFYDPSLALAVGNAQGPTGQMTEN